MKKIFLIIFLIIFIIISYKIITLSHFPSKYLDSEDLKWHLFTKDKKIIKEFTDYYFLIKSIHIAGDFKEIKAFEIHTFLPYFLIKFYKIKGFLLKKTPYSILFYKPPLFKYFFETLKKKEKSFGWIKTEQMINFNLSKNKFFVFESKLNVGNFYSKNETFKIRDFDLEIYKASSLHFSLIFPEIKEIEVYYKNGKGFFKIKEGKKEKILKIGEIEDSKYRKEILSFYFKMKDPDLIKKFIKNKFLENLKEIEIKCFYEENVEICQGYFLLKN